jgi:hypothetical protein
VKATNGHVPTDEPHPPRTLQPAYLRQWREMERLRRRQEWSLRVFSFAWGATMTLAIAYLVLRLLGKV